MAWSPDYLTTAQLKAYLRITDSDDDVQLAVAITAASRAVDNTTNRQFGKTESAEQRTYQARLDRHRARRAWVVDVDDVATTTGLTVSVNGTAVTDYTLEPANAVLKGKVWTLLVFGRNAEAIPSHGEDFLVDVTATWGWASVPTAIEQATYIQAARFNIRRDSPYGIAGSPQAGNEMRLLARLDPDVQVVVAGYVRRWGAVSGPVPHPGPHLHLAGWGLGGA